MRRHFLPHTRLTWRAVATGPVAAAAPEQRWWLRAWQWLVCAFQLLLGRLAVVAYVPVHLARVPRALRATQPGPPFRFTRRFLSSLRSPPCAAR